MVILTYHHASSNQLVIADFSVDQLTKNFFLSTFILSIFLYFKSVKSPDTIDFIDLIWSLFVNSISTFIGLMLFKSFADYHISEELLSPKLYQDLIYHFIIAFITIFAAKTFYTFKRMILYQKTILISKSWTVFESVTLCLIVFNFFPYDYFEPFNYIIVASTTVAGLVLSVNMKWVAYLNFNQKWRSILLLFIILLIAGSFIEFIYNQTKGELIYDTYDHHGIYHDLGSKVFFISLSLFILFYCVSSILVLLFNLPTSSVFEQKIGEIFSIQKLSETIKLTNNESEIYQTLIDTSYVATFSDAIWLEVVDEDGNYKDFKNLNIDKYDIFELKKALKKEGHYFKKNTVQIQELKKLKHLDEFKHKSCLIIPLTASSQYLGAIGFLKDTKEGFNQEIKNIAAMLAHQASTAIVNSRLLVEEIKTQQYKKEIKIAEEVKKKLLPSIPKLSEAFDSSVKTISADEVGGDFYTSGQLSDNKYYYAIADISGHGTSAAFNMAQLKGAFEALIPLGLSSSELLEKLNLAISACFEATSFLSMTILIIDTLEKTVEINRAGHCPTLLLSDNTETIQGKGLGLAILRNKEFSQHIQPEYRIWKKGNTILLFTDGFVESTNIDNQEFGLENLTNVFEKNSNLSTPEIVEALFKELQHFCGDQPITDDVTCLVIKFN